MQAQIHTPHVVVAQPQTQYASRTRLDRSPVVQGPTVLIMDISDEEARLWDRYAMGTKGFATV